MSALAPTKKARVIWTHKTRFLAYPLRQICQPHTQNKGMARTATVGNRSGSIEASVLIRACTAHHASDIKRARIRGTGALYRDRFEG